MNLIWKDNAIYTVYDKIAIDLILYTIFKAFTQSNRRHASGCISAIQFHLHAHHAEYTDTGILGNFYDHVSLDSLGGSFRPAQMTFCVNLVHIAITTRELSSQVSISSVLLDYRAISCKLVISF